MMTRSLIQCIANRSASACVFYGLMQSLNFLYYNTDINRLKEEEEILVFRLVEFFMTREDLNIHNVALQSSRDWK